MDISRIKVFQKTLCIFLFVGALFFEILGLLVPLREYQWDAPAKYSNQTSADGALFIIASCAISIVLFLLTWIMMNLWFKSVNIRCGVRLVFISLLFICLVRITFVWPFFEG